VVIAEAQELLKLSPDKPVLQYYSFCALTALGEYEQATALFRVIVGRTPTSRGEFRDWSMKYVFDTLEARRSWRPADRTPVGAAFLPMLEADETYRELSPKAKRVITDGSPRIGRRMERSWPSAWGCMATMVWRSSIPPQRKLNC